MRLKIGVVLQKNTLFPQINPNFHPKINFLASLFIKMGLNIPQINIFL